MRRPMLDFTLHIGCHVIVGNAGCGSLVSWKAIAMRS
jgi:hypothetical protein